MRGHFNVNGFNIFMAYETGWAFGVDFCRGYGRYMLGETNTIDLLERKEPDCFMVIAADHGWFFKFTWVIGFICNFINIKFS